jgi:hypothetical protein
VALAVLSVLLGASCDLGRPALEELAPPPELLAAEVLGPDAQGEPTWHRLTDGTTPSGYADTILRLTFDRYLDPRKVTRQAVCLRSGLGDLVESTDCTRAVVLRPSYDPTSRTAQFAVRVEEPLVPDVVYELTVYAAGTSVSGLRSLDGVPLATPYKGRFRSRADRRPEDAVAAPVACADAVDALRVRCGGCHGANEPAAGLDLSSSEGLEQTALGQVAHGASVGGASNVSPATPTRLGAGMAVIAPSDPGQSYLLYKLLAASGPSSEGLREGETERMAELLLAGDPMPPNGEFELGDAPGELGWLARWIAEGACTR